MQRIQKDLEESSGVEKGVAAWKPLSDHSNQKRSAEFLGDFRAMIVNNYCKWMKSIARNLKVSY